MQGCDGGCKVRSLGMDSIITEGVQVLRGVSYKSWQRIAVQRCASVLEAALWVVPTDMCAVRVTWRQLSGHHHGSMCMCACVPVQVCEHTYASVYIYMCACLCRGDSKPLSAK